MWRRLSVIFFSYVTITANIAFFPISIESKVWTIYALNHHIEKHSIVQLWLYWQFWWHDTLSRWPLRKRFDNLSKGLLTLCAFVVINVLIIFFSSVICCMSPVCILLWFVSNKHFWSRSCINELVTRGRSSTVQTMAWAPVRRLATTWTSDDIWSNQHRGTNFRDILIKMKTKNLRRE